MRASGPFGETSDAASRIESSTWRRVFCFAVAVWLGALVVACFVATRHWPVVNDGALQHYISFLMDRGLAPYRQIQDMNLPGSLLLDWSVVHTLGPGDLAWRCFDISILCLAAIAFVVITESARRDPETWLAGLFSAALFALLHTRDGMGQAGQRDLSESVLLLMATAFLFSAARRRQPALLVGFGVCAGAAMTIKPDSLLPAAIFLLLFLRELRRRATVSLSSYLIAAFAGFLLPMIVVLLFLIRCGAVHDFWLSVTEITPYYASLGRLPFAALVRTCFSAPMRLLALFGIVCASILRRSGQPASTTTDGGGPGNAQAWEQMALLLGTLWGLASFFLQGKGYPYQRYTALAFLLPLCAVQFTDALRSRRRMVTAAGVASLLYGALVIAPESLYRAVHAPWDQTHIAQMERDLLALGAKTPGKSVQCVDSISGCNTALLRLGIAEPTGMLSDFLIFGPESQSAVRRTRATFLPAMEARPPDLLVVTSWLHPKGVTDYGKLALWPTFQEFLNQRYTLVLERSFGPGPNGPRGYRVYQRK